MEQTKRRLDSFLAHGVTTVEGKSGYGMNLETELKQLRVMKKLQEEHPIDLVPTFMGAHAVPKDYKGREDEFVDHLINDIFQSSLKKSLLNSMMYFVKRGFYP